MLQCDTGVSTCMPVQMQLENPTSVDVLLQLSISRVGASEDALTSFQKSSDILHGLRRGHKQKMRPQAEGGGISAALQNTSRCCNVTSNWYRHWVNHLCREKPNGCLPTSLHIILAIPHSLLFFHAEYNIFIYQFISSVIYVNLSYLAHSVIVLALK